MRLPLVCLGAALALSACGSTQTPVHPLAPRSERSIRLYDHSIPRCPFREVGSVSGRTYRELQTMAFRLHANAVIMEPEGENQRTVRRGTAVQFTRPGCMQ
jgi:hypothetical protein